MESHTESNHLNREHTDNGRASGNKKIKVSGFEMETSDNIISIRKKKLEALKMRSNRKKGN